LKRRDLANAKAEALGNNHHRAVRLFDLRHDGLELFRSQNRWAFPALGAAFNANQRNRVSPLGEEFPSARHTDTSGASRFSNVPLTSGPYRGSSANLRPPSDGCGRADSHPSVASGDSRCGPIRLRSGVPLWHLLLHVSVGRLQPKVTTAIPLLRGFRVEC